MHHCKECGNRFTPIHITGHSAETYCTPRCERVAEDRHENKFFHFMTLSGVETKKSVDKVRST